MKLKVTLTRQPNFDIDDFDFLTEASENEELAKLEKEAKKATEEYRAYYRSCKGETDEKKKEELINGIDPIYDKMIAANLKVNQFKQKMAAQSQQQNQNQAQECLKTIMSRFGNSISGMFKWIWDQIVKIPGLMRRIGGHLKNLWEKIKGWMSKYYIVDRAKTLSKLALACIGFVSTLVLICIHRVPGAEPKDSHISYYLDRFKHPEKYVNKPDADKVTIKKTNDDKTTTAETAVFIETLGEILREDTNGGVFMTVARKFIKRGKKIADDVCIACRNFKNNRLKKLVNTLRTLVYGSSEALEDGSTPVADNTMPSRFRRRLYNETAFDDSLESFYESIILEAQAHKLRSIRKKAIKKVALKNARKSLKG